MADSKLPYVTGYGNITKALDGIRRAATPDRFTQDFLASKLGLKGGTPKPVIPFLKRTGFLASDGSPTDRYKQFRNDSSKGMAAAEALREGFNPLFQIDENVHKATDDELRGLIVQITGTDKDSSTVAAILGSFKALKAYADFTRPSPILIVEEPDLSDNHTPDEPESLTPLGISLGYTINLNLPATTDIAVFNAIFRSLRENLLR